MTAPGKPSGRDLVITVSGLHGTGKTTYAMRIAEALGLRYVSAGEMFRRMAEEREITLEEMSRLAEGDPEIDRLVDERTRGEARRGGAVIDATLSGWMVQDADIKIFLTAPLDVRVRRIAARDGLSVEEAEDATLLREEIERRRFGACYGIDISDLSIYDVVLNTELFDADGASGILKKVVEEYCSRR